MATMNHSADRLRPHHDFEQSVGRAIMTIWGAVFLLVAVVFLATLPEPGSTMFRDGLLAGGLCALVGAPAVIAWRKERLGSVLLVGVALLIAVGYPIGVYVAIQNGVMRESSGDISPWWDFALFDAIVAVPPLSAGLLLLDHLHRQEKENSK